MKNLFKKFTLVFTILPILLFTGCSKTSSSSSPTDNLPGKYIISQIAVGDESINSTDADFKQALKGFADDWCNIVFEKDGTGSLSIMSESNQFYWEKVDDSTIKIAEDKEDLKEDAKENDDDVILIKYNSSEESISFEQQGMQMTMTKINE